MLLITAAVVLLPAGAGKALTDCTCYDISRADTANPPKLVLKNQGVRGWNLLDVSPDRTRVIFSHPGLEIADIKGAGPRSLSKSAGNFAAFSPNGELVAFSERPGRAAALIVARTSGGVVRAFRGPLGGWAAWAPDSSRLVFTVYRSRSSPLGRLGLGDISTGQVRTLTPWRTNLSGGTSIGIKASWSPDGSRIAYIEGTPLPRLHVLDVDTGNDRIIARGRAPVWSPDGHRIAFAWRDRTLAVIDVDGTNLHVVDPRARDPYFFGAAWSPRGHSIAYRLPFIGDELWMAHPDGTHRHRLTRAARNEEIGPIYWAPDGQTILYTHMIQGGD